MGYQTNNPGNCQKNIRTTSQGSHSGRLFSKSSVPGCGCDMFRLAVFGTDILSEKLGGMPVVLPPVLSCYRFHLCHNWTVCYDRHRLLDIDRFFRTCDGALYFLELTWYDGTWKNAKWWQASLAEAAFWETLCYNFAIPQIVVRLK